MYHNECTLPPHIGQLDYFLVSMCLFLLVTESIKEHPVYNFVNLCESIYEVNS